MPKQKRFTESELPRPGNVFLTPLADGRYGVVRVIRTMTGSGYAFAYVVPSSWIGDCPVRPSDAEIRQPLLNTRGSRIPSYLKRDGEQDACWVCSPPPPSFLPVGDIAVTKEDDAIQHESYSGWEWFPMVIFSQWQWDNDREGYLARVAEYEAKAAEERRIAAERRAEMLRTLTFESVAQRVWFDNWDEELDGANITASRHLVAGLVEDLRAAPKLTKVVVRRLLRDTVKAFNRLDQESDHFIETTHREDICDALEMVDGPPHATRTSPTKWSGGGIGSGIPPPLAATPGNGGGGGGGGGVRGNPDQVAPPLSCAGRRNRAQ